MVKRVQVAEAKARLSALLERVESGEEIIIARRGKAVARLVPEPTANRSAADVLRAAARRGGLTVAAPPDLATDGVSMD